MSEIKTAEQRIHKLEGGEGDSFVTFEQALIAERDELRKALAERDAKLAALEAIAYSDDGAGGEGMKLLLENREMKARLAALEKQEQKLDYFVLQQFADDNAISYNKLCTAVKMSIITAGAAPNAWKDAILEVMTIYGMDAPITDAPEKIIKDLIELATIVAMDPTPAAGAAPVPEGWQLVPVEPTDAMCEAAYNGRYSGGHPSSIYNNMLAAAPKEPTCSAQNL